METRLSDLRYREVIHISTGMRLGFVGDLLLDAQTGQVLALIVPGPARFFGLFGREDDYVLPWSSIARMGTDIILVEIEQNQPRRHRQKRKIFDFSTKNLF